MFAALLAAGAWGASGNPGSWYEALVVMGSLVATLAAAILVVERIERRRALMRWLRQVLPDEGKGLPPIPPT